MGIMINYRAFDKKLALLQFCSVKETDPRAFIRVLNGFKPNAKVFSVS